MEIINLIPQNECAHRYHCITDSEICANALKNFRLWVHCLYMVTIISPLLREDLVPAPAYLLLVP